MFVTRYQQPWASFVLIRRQDLYGYYQLSNVGTVAENALILNLQYKSNSILCSDVDLSRYLNNWSQFPILDP